MNADTMPWPNLVSRYIGRDTGVLAHSPAAWLFIEKPLQPIKKLIAISLLENGGIESLISLQPIVTSIIPAQIPYMKLDKWGEKGIKI